MIPSIFTKANEPPAQIMKNPAPYFKVLFLYAAKHADYQKKFDFGVHAQLVLFWSRLTTTRQV